MGVLAHVWSERAANVLTAPPCLIPHTLYSLTQQQQVLNAQLCGDRPTESDSTLYPSDHIGLKVTLRISKTAGSAATAAAGGVAAASGGGADGGARESAGGSSSK